MKDANITPVGYLIEWRGVVLYEGGLNHLHTYIDGLIPEDCPTGQVYMMTQNCYAWRKESVADQALAYHNATNPDTEEDYTSIEQLTNDDYNSYMHSGFPSRAGNNVSLFTDSSCTTYGTDYPTPFWRQDYNYTNSTDPMRYDGTPGVIVSENGLSALAEATEATYGEGIYTPGNGSYYYQDSCLVMAHQASIDKSVAQKIPKTDGSEGSKYAYDMSQNERTVDYVLNASIQRGVSAPETNATATQTIVYIEDVLPASLSYLEGSAHIGGTYIQDESFSGLPEYIGGAGFDLANEVGLSEPNEAHKLLLKYNVEDNRLLFMILTDVPVKDITYLPPIYYSCTIGEPGSSNDVTNGQTIVNTVTIWTSEDCHRERIAKYGNADTCSISIQKLSAISLSKISDHLVVEQTERMGFTMNVGNNSSQPYVNTLIVETLPFRGIYSTHFTGPLEVSDFHAAVVNNDGKIVPNNFQFFYSTDIAYVGKLSGELETMLDDEITQSGQSMSLIDWLNSPGSSWQPLTFGAQETVNGMTLYSADNLPEVTGTYEDGTPRQITSIIALGKLDPSCTMKMHIGIDLPQGLPTDYLVNYLSRDTLSSYARSQIVKRTLEGLTWMDEDMDGIQDKREQLLSGVKVTLLKLDETTGTYNPVCYPGTDISVTIETGQQVNIQESPSSILSHQEGRYRFTGLLEGTYCVLFESSKTVSISTYTVSPLHAGTDIEVDSDAVGSYDNVNLSNARIEGIVMSPAEYLSSGSEESQYHDCGFFQLSRYELPNTGGVGTHLMTALGLLFTAGGTVGMARKKKKH